MSLSGMPSRNHIDGFGVRSVLGKAGGLSHEMDSLALHDRPRALPGQGHFALDHDDHLFMAMARLQDPSLLAWPEHAIDKVAGVAAGLIIPKDMLSLLTNLTRNLVYSHEITSHVSVLALTGLRGTLSQVAAERNIEGSVRAERIRNHQEG
jgi:hypothetical protein